MGIIKSEVKKYWRDRSLEQSRDTVGYKGNLNNQKQEYEDKISFVTSAIKNVSSLELSTVDYGCGVGRWADIFDDYIGIDVCKELYEYAILDYPHKDFALVSSPFNIPMKFGNRHRFFTSAVLQHNANSAVEWFFKARISKLFFKEFVFYESCEEKTNKHVIGRSSEEYFNIVKKYIDVKLAYKDTHIIHGRKHSVTILKRIGLDENDDENDKDVLTIAERVCKRFKDMGRKEMKKKDVFIFKKRSFEDE